MRARARAAGTDADRLIVALMINIVARRNGTAVRPLPCNIVSEAYRLAETEATVTARVGTI